MNRLSFWLLPPKKIQAIYQPLTTPRFEPHITLTTAVVLKGENKSILQIIEAVVKNLRPIPVELTEVSVSTTYFQCVFARVKPTLELLQVHQLVRSALRHSDLSMYVPHMSLVYGNISLEQRFKIAQEIKLPVTKFIADRISAINAGSLNPKTWKQIAAFKL